MTKRWFASTTPVCMLIKSIQTLFLSELDDAVVPPVNGDKMASALEAQHVRYRLLEKQSGGHGFGLGSDTELRGWLEEAINFCEKNDAKGAVI